MEESLTVAERHLKLAFAEFDKLGNNIGNSKQIALLEDSMNKIAEVMFNISELKTS